MQRIEIETAAGQFSVLDWNEAPAGAPLLHFAHATGMHAGVYARLLAPLAKQFRIIASDARGHGRSTAATDDRACMTWEAYAEDMLAILDSVDSERPWLLAGHSLGGTVSLLAAATWPERVAGLVMLDPPMLPFALARAAADGEVLPNPMAEQAVRRRPSFPDMEAVRTAYRRRGVFSTWSDDDLEAYLADGLLPQPDGTLALACTPSWEAATFRGGTTSVEQALATLTCPFALVAGEIRSTVPEREFAIMAAHQRCVSADRLPGTTHFVPLERGDEVRAALLRVSDTAAAESTSRLRRVATA